MKITSSIFIYLILVVAEAIVFSCKKAEIKHLDQPQVINTEQVNGFPADLTNINGYLYASYRSNTVTENEYTFYSTFSDPGHKLLEGWNHYCECTMGSGIARLFGNVDVGIVAFNNELLLQKTSVPPTLFYSFQNNNYLQPLTIGKWSTEGNHSFSPLDIVVLRGFPTVAASATFAPVSLAAGYTLDINQYVTNFDSVTVSIYNSTSWQTNIKKNVTSGIQFITFSPGELSSLTTGTNAAISIYAYNYSNQVINNKIYLYEMSGKAARSLTINP